MALSHIVLLLGYFTCVYGAGLMIETLEEPTNCKKISKQGDWLKVHYVGTLQSDGSQFDSSYDREEPFEFLLGNGEVIKGWDQGLIGMCKNEKRRLTVPPELGYGKKRAGDVIPGDATLVFDIELVAIEDAPKENNIFTDIDKDGDKLLSQDEVRTFLSKQMGGGAPGMEGMLDNMVNEFIRIQDKNKDGRITQGEFAKPTVGRKRDEL